MNNGMETTQDDAMHVIANQPHDGHAPIEQQEVKNGNMDIETEQFMHDVALICLLFIVICSSALTIMLLHHTKYLYIQFIENWHDYFEFYS